MVLTQAIELTPVDFTLLSGYREQEEQDELFAKGMSKLKYPMSKHNTNPSMAVDFAPYPIDWKDERAFSLVAGVIITVGNMNNIKLRWGGDWDNDGSTRDQTFMDLGHLELV